MTSATTKTRLEILGGIGEIGYSMVLVSTPRARVLLDMGLRMRGMEDDPLRLPARVRPEHALVDLLRAETLRPLPGIYDPAQLSAEFAPLANPDPRPTAIALSHAHIDHDGGLGFARPELPVYASVDSARVLEALASSGAHRLGHGVAPVAIAPGEPVILGDLQVTLLEVDHDVPGACGVLVDTPAGSVAYTGDLNFHRGENSRVFAERIHGVDVLITETTMLSFPEPNLPPRTEEEIDVEFLRVLQSRRALVLCSLYPRDVERAARVARLVREQGRTLVWPTRDALFLDLMDVDGVATWAADRPELSRVEPSSRVARVSLEDVRANPEAYVVQPDAHDVPALADLPVTPGESAWVHSQGEPLGPFMPGWGVFIEWLERLGVTRVEAGSSGHATGADLHEFVEQVAPGTVMPIHGLRPEALRVSSRTVLPRYGEVYAVREGGVG